MSDSHAGHSHNLERSPERSLRWALLLTGGFMVIEALGGFFANSLALLSDAAHMLTDTAALAIALAAIHLGKRAADKRRTYGYARFEILAAAFNAVILFFVAIYILWEAVERFVNPAPVQSATMMLIAAAGLIINLISMKLLQGDSGKNLNLKSAYLEVWSDMLGSIGVLLAGAIIYFTDWKPIDPIIAVLIGLWVLPRTWIILKDSLNILLEGAPAGLNPEEISDAIRSIPGVSGSHDLHVWAVASGKILLTAHVEYDTNRPIADKEILSSVQKMLKERFAIHHSTLQLENACCDNPDCTLNEAER